MKKFFMGIGFNKKFILASITVAFCFVVVVLINNFIFPHICLVGEEKVIVDYNKKYSDAGYEASLYGEDITDEVVVKGNVNTKKVGTYHVTYSVGDGIFKRKVVREVEVVDREKPTLDTEKSDIYVCPGTKFKAEKVKAFDNYDGDLTKSVESEVFDDRVVYSVSDSSGNKRTVTRKLFYEDKDSPVVTLEGSEVVNLCVNEEYHEAGYKVSDNCDSNLKVDVSGEVNNSSVGEYKLTYEAVDKAGNKGSAERSVIVSNGDALGTVYLTFDDGPNYGTTDVILDILKEEGVHATFFVTGFGPDELIKREHDEGHTVALHTMKHDYAMVYASDEAYYNDLAAIHDRVLRITGVDSHIIRFPGGSSNTVSRRYSSGIMSRLTNGVTERGYRYFDWNVSSGDAGGTTDSNQVYSNVVNSLRKDRVNNVLMHDVKPHTRDALRNIIRYCKENGYEMKAIGNCSTQTTQRVNN